MGVPPPSTRGQEEADLLAARLSCRRCLIVFCGFFFCGSFGFSTPLGIMTSSQPVRHNCSSNTLRPRERPVIRAAADPAYPQLPRVGQMLRNVQRTACETPFPFALQPTIPAMAFAASAALPFAPGSSGSLVLRPASHTTACPASSAPPTRPRSSSDRRCARGAGEVRGPGLGLRQVAEAREGGRSASTHDEQTLRAVYDALREHFEGQTVAA